MEKYPLAPLLKVREYREDAAKNALSAAERAVVEAQEAVERCRGELERYKVWRQEEVERRYDAIMGKGLSLKELDVFKAGLGALADGELKLEEAIAQALENVKKRQEDVRKAREAARQAQHETAKIVTHRDIWLVEAKREAERLEDLEMEEFKPLPPQGPKASSGGVSPSKGRKHWGKEGNLSGETFFPSGFLKICRYGSYPALSNAFASIMPCIFQELSAGWSDSPFKIKKPVHKRRNAGGVVWLTL